MPVPAPCAPSYPMVVLTSTRPLDTAAAAAACWGVSESVCGASLGGAPGTTPGGALGAVLGGAVGLGRGGELGADGSADAEGLGAATAGSSVDRRAPSERDAAGQENGSQDGCDHGQATAAGRGWPHRRLRGWGELLGPRMARTHRRCRGAPTAPTSTGPAGPTVGRRSSTSRSDPGRPAPSWPPLSVFWTATAAGAHSVR